MSTIPGSDISRTTTLYGVEHKNGRHGWKVIGWVGTAEAAWRWVRCLQKANPGDWRVKHPQMNGGHRG